jgi:hypothetical protein
VSRRFSVAAGFYRTCVIDLRHSYRHPVDVMPTHMGRDQVKHAIAERSQGQTKVNLGQNAGFSIDRDLTRVPRFAAMGG